MPPVFPLILASASPRRQELLHQLGLSFSVQVSQVPEVRSPDEAPEAYVLRLAQAKAQAVAQQHPQALVLGADTTVVCQGQVLEKPRDRADGLAMLAALSGRSHQVHTAVCLRQGQHQQTHCLVTTRVQFRTITPSEAQAYWATQEPCDKAGGYAIQGKGALFITGIEGSYSNVVGLPLAETAQLLEGFGVNLWSHPHD